MVILIWTLVLITKFIGRVCPRDSTCLPCNDIIADLTTLYDLTVHMRLLIVLQGNIIILYKAAALICIDDADSTLQVLWSVLSRVDYQIAWSHLVAMHHICKYYIIIMRESFWTFYYTVATSSHVKPWIHLWMHQVKRKL